MGRSALYCYLKYIVSIQLMRQGNQSKNGSIEKLAELRKQNKFYPLTNGND
jgi:hypothetical protein